MPATIIDEGLDRVATVIGGDTPYIAVGTDNTDPASSDSQLGTESTRAVASAAIDGNKVTFSATIANASLPATTEEAGLFLNASGAANSGSMLVRALVHFVKGSDDLTLVFEFTFNEG